MQVKAFSDFSRWSSVVGLQDQTARQYFKYFLVKKRQLRSTEEDDCSRRSRVMHALNYTFYSNEYTMHNTNSIGSNASAGVCADFTNAIVLRDPGR